MTSGARTKCDLGSAGSIVLAAGHYYLFNLKHRLTLIMQSHYSVVLSVRDEVVRYGITTRLKPDAGVFMQVNSPPRMNR
jgi:hypothetical protein